MSRPPPTLLAGAARHLGALGGWRRALAAGLLGLCATLALPPLALVPLAVVAFSGLVWLAAGSATRTGWFALGFWFGLGHFLSGLYWVGNAFAPAGVSTWLAPFAVVALAATCAVFPGLALLAARVSGATGVAGVVVLATAWTGAEWLRAFALFGGFPWNLAGYVWMPSGAGIQLAALFGVFGLSWLAVLAAALPAQLAEARGAWRAVAAAWAAVALAHAGGAVRLGIAEVAEVPGVELRLVQANISQFHKWQPALRERHLAKQLELSALPGVPPPSHMIWPETATPYVLAEDGAVRAALAAVVPLGGALITGALRVETGDHGFRVWNSLEAVDGAGRIVAAYDKARLVPFGEYVPLRSILDLAKLTDGETDFSRGPGPRTLAIPGLPPVSPLICYEAIFPGRVVDPQARPDWLLNVTNDAWYGDSAGPYQHFEQARLRAVEEGLPLVRVANTGISGVVDPYGRVTARLGLGEEGVIDAPLPRPAPLRTPYSRWRDWPLLALVVAVALWSQRRRRQADARAKRS
ncbi:MAG TPA: apolipoprotein N-acyltransferase [Alphaproteobacteria bacterium]